MGHGECGNEDLCDLRLARGSRAKPPASVAGGWGFPVLLTALCSGRRVRDADDAKGAGGQPRAQRGNFLCCRLLCAVRAAATASMRCSLPRDLKLGDIHLVPIDCEPVVEALKVPVCLWRCTFLVVRKEC